MRRVLPLIAVLSLAFAPAPFPRREKKTTQMSIQQAYAKIYLRMPEDELYKLMSPFKRGVCPAESASWSDGQFKVWVSIGLGGGPLRLPPQGVERKVLLKKSDTAGQRFILISDFILP